MNDYRARDYYWKRIGLFRWQVWWCYIDRAPDQHSGATEWLACTHTFWNWRPAARVAVDLFAAYHSGIDAWRRHVGELR